jgi:hypothetical protein
MLLLFLGRVLAGSILWDKPIAKGNSILGGGAEVVAIVVGY